jgi:hypothetical protein
MDYCGTHGLAWSRFLSWDQASRDAALLWQQDKHETCAGCGTHPDDWDPEHGGHARAYVATVVDCPGCAAIATRQERLAKEIEKGKYSPAARVGLRRQVEREV